MHLTKDFQLILTIYGVCFPCWYPFSTDESSYRHTSSSIPETDDRCDIKWPRKMVVYITKIRKKEHQLWNVTYCHRCVMLLVWLQTSTKANANATIWEDNANHSNQCNCSLFCSDWPGFLSKPLGFCPPPSCTFLLPSCLSVGQQEWLLSLNSSAQALMLSLPINLDTSRPSSSCTFADSDADLLSSKASNYTSPLPGLLL